MKKRVLSLLACLCMVAALVPAFAITASAAEAWLWPVDGVYAMSRGYYSGHYGIDIAASLGTTVRATKSGTVIESENSCPHTNYGSGCSCNGGCGNYVKIKHDDGTYSRYLHLTQGTAIATGTYVRQGETIGKSGSSGDSDGPHLHFECFNTSNSRMNNNPSDSRHTYYGSHDGASFSYVYTAGKPTNVSVTTNKSIYSLGETVTMTPSASGAEKFTLRVCYDHYGGDTTVFSDFAGFNGAKTYTPGKTGTYIVRVSAISSAGEWTDAECTFTVGNMITIDPGTYYLESALKSDMVMDVDGGSKEACANIQLYQNNNTVAQQFEIKPSVGSYYTITNVGSGCAVDVGYDTPSGQKNIFQQTVNDKDYQNFRFFDAGNGYVYIQSAFGPVIDVYGGGTTNGSNIWSYPYNGTAAQRWKLIPVQTNSDSISEISFPSSIKKGESVTLTGNITANYEITWVWIGVKNRGTYNHVIEVSTNPLQTSYEITNLAKQLDFASLSPGDYTLSIEGTGGNQYHTWYSKDFTVVEKHTHTFTHTLATPATCTDPGNTEYWTCTDCGKYFSDAAGTNEIPQASTVINPLGHSYENGICTRCGEKDPNYVGPTPNIPEIHFPRKNVYHQGQFTDVPTNQWYTTYVASAFELGLVRGDSATTYNPYGNVTVAEAITMAARIHSIYTTGTESFVQTGKWYQVYLDYAYNNGIISYAYYNSDVEQTATRAQFAEIFANAMDSNGLYPMNSVADNAIPDVKTSAYYAPAVYKLYRAGILTGSDVKGTFNPDTYITRAEAATILARMADTDNRVAFSMG